MSEIPVDLRFTESHEWIAQDEDGLLRVGITDHAQSKLGDLVFVDLPEVGASLNAGDSCAVVESVKAASDIYAPVAGEIVAVNDSLADSPDLVNTAPYGDGWLFTIKPQDGASWDSLMSAESYNALLADS